MKRHIKLNEEQRNELNERMRTEKRAKILNRLLYINMKDMGKKNSEIQNIIFVSSNTFSRWTTLFLEKGFF